MNLVSVRDHPSSATTTPVRPGLLRRIARRVHARTKVANPALDDISYIEASQSFDKPWYLRRYPDVAASGMDPIQHFVRHGVTEGRNPAEDFDTTFYLEHNPDVAASGVNPFRHYLEHGLREGRAGSPVAVGKHFQARTSQPAKGKIRTGGSRSVGERESDAQTLAHAGVFDDAYYVAANPGVAPSGMDPIGHYLKFGAAEGTNPCALFDTRYYLQNNPDVAASGMNPLVHFCRYGFSELRNPSSGFDVSWYWLTHLLDDVNTNPLAHYLSVGKRKGLEMHSTAEVLAADGADSLAALCRERLAREGDHPRVVYLRLGIVLSRLKCWKDAEAAFSRALALEWGDAGAHARLAAALAKQGKWWQAVESWVVATNLDAQRASWFFHLGEAQEKMNRFALAAEAYQQAIDRDLDHPGWYYLLGFMHEKAGASAPANAAYSEAVARDRRKDVKAFGIGVFHQARGYWPEAAEAYARDLERKPDEAELHYRLGMAHDRCYRWAEAEAAYRNAIALQPATPYWHYRYGFVLERQERFPEAAQAYAAAATLSPKPKPYWWYRCGYVRAATGEHELGCRAYLRTREQQTLSSDQGESREGIPTPGLESSWLDDYLGGFPSEKLLSEALARDTTNPETHYRLGEALERKQDWNGAAKAYAGAVARSNPHRPAWYYRLGFVLFHAGRFEEACAAFRETRVFRLPYGVNTGADSKDPEVYRTMQYRDGLDALPVQPRVVLYESTHGASVGGNPYAIFEYLLNHPDYRDWTHVWSITPDAAVPADLRARPKVVFVEHDSDLYLRYLATASHLINDSTFPYWFSRRPEQKYLNTWHGTPLKTLGKPIRAEEEFLSHRNIQRNLLHTTHLISPNQHTSDVLMNDFDVRGIYAGKLAETGYPRIDRTLNASPGQIAQIRARLGLKQGVPVALYAPTWRGIFGQTEVDVDRLRADLKRLATLPCQWLFRGHPFSEGLLRDAGLPVTIAPRDLDTSDVLAVTDILVTDYSSIFFDFLPTGRPIFHYCYDLDEYANSRGMYFSIHDMPGTVCLDIDALVRGLDRAMAQGNLDAGRYESALRKFCPHEDGHATARTVDFFFHGDDSRVVTRYGDDRPSLLFFGGHFAPNGINSSFLNLMHALQESGKYHITVVVEPNRIKNEPVWLEAFRRLPKGVAVLAKTGRMVFDAEQEWIAGRFRARRGFASPAMRQVFQDSYQNEFHRVFGQARIDALVDFDGYGPYWTTLFGIGSGGRRRFTWLHNDFFEEFILKHPYLRSQFEMYSSYDALVSVSPYMEEVNRRKLAERFNIQSGKFTHCTNVIDRIQIIERAKQPIDMDLIPWFENATTFMTIGRMSPEKDHGKLIDAFALVHSRHPETRLVILGDGPLRVALKESIRKLGLEQAVCLAGWRPNPFPALQRCDCFVLSSNHEGQPMVLLEALALGRPVIATDIDGNRGVLKEVYGCLVGNSVAGLERGMLQFLQGKLVFQPFDAVAYRDEAIAEFDAIVASAVERGGGTADGLAAGHRSATEISSSRVP